MPAAESMGLILFLWIVGSAALLVYFTRNVDFGPPRSFNNLPERTDVLPPRN